MIGVVLGNGPSKKEYDRSGDLVIGCNIPTKDFSVDATVICDEEIVWVLKNNLTLIDVPVIISTKVYEKMKELKIVDNFQVVSVFKPSDWHNAAHYAADRLIDLGCTEIHIWGCDSIFEDDIESETSQHVEKHHKGDARFIKNWRRVWLEKKQNNPNVNFVAFRIKNI
jgi:hypothetical protein